MTYKTDDYNKLDRNHTWARSMLNYIDTARDFNLLKYTERASIVATTRDGEKIEITLTGEIKKAVIAAGVERCTTSAKILSAENVEEVDFDRAAAV